MNYGQLFGVLLSLVAATPTIPARDGVIEDAAHGFRFKIPAGYVDAPRLRSPDVLHAFDRGNDADSSFIVITGVGDLITPRQNNHEDVERSARQSVLGSGIELTRFGYRKLKWKHFELDEVVIWLDDHLGSPSIAITTQVPLVNEAINIRVGGRASDEARLQADLELLLASIDGKSNWRDPADEERTVKVIAALILSFLGVTGGVVWWRRRRRRGEHASDR